MSCHSPCFISFFSKPSASFVSFHPICSYPNPSRFFSLYKLSQTNSTSFLPLKKSNQLFSFKTFSRKKGNKTPDSGSDSDSGSINPNTSQSPSSSSSYYSESELEFDDDEEDEDWDELEKIEPATLKVTNEILKGYWEEQEEGEAGYPLVEEESVDFKEAALPDDELWWNWKTPEPGKEGWSAWQKRPGNADAAMAAAAAEMKQIKLFGDKPSIAETALARTRKKVLSQERLDMEDRLREEMGDMAYYKQWVEGYEGETRKEEVQRRAEEKNESMGYQIAEMFSHLTEREVRLLMATDARVQRDPLCYRMTPKQVMEVWGGDPVYPSVNYIHDVNKVADYRGPNFHEPRTNLMDALEREGRIITQEEIEELEKQDAAEEYESFVTFGEIDEAVDIGDKDDDEDIDEDEEEEDDIIDLSEKA